MYMGLQLPKTEQNRPKVYNKVRLLSSFLNPIPFHFGG